MKKRGVITGEVILFMVELMLIGMCFISLMSFVQTIANKTLVEKNFLSKDLSLVLNTMYASPGIIKYTYYFDEIDLSKFTFDLKYNKVGVADAATPNNVKPVQTMYRYGNDDSIKLSKDEIGGFSDFQLANNGRTIFIDEKLKITDYRLYCLEPESGLKIGKIILDPGHGGNDKGLESGDKKESEEMLRLVKFVDDELSDFEVESTRGKNIDYTRDVEPLTSRYAQVKELQNYDLVMSFHLGKYDKNKNYLKAYVSSARDGMFRSFVCNVVDTLGDIKIDGKNIFDEVTIFEIDGDEVPNNSYEVVLKHPNSVIFEVGNIDSDKTDYSEIAKGINDMLMRFR